MSVLKERLLCICVVQECSWALRCLYPVLGLNWILTVRCTTVWVGLRLIDFRMLFLSWWIIWDWGSLASWDVFLGTFRGSYLCRFPWWCSWFWSCCRRTCYWWEHRRLRWRWLDWRIVLGEGVCWFVRWGNWFVRWWREGGRWSGPIGGSSACTGSYPVPSARCRTGLGPNRIWVWASFSSFSYCPWDG